jgi:SOS-response transcriptional repressor LexA/DNA-binding XRE family transcriptional regulator
MENLAERLADFRKTSGKSQREFAEMVGVPQTTWSGYESGKFTPPMKVLIALEKNGYGIPGLTSNLSVDLKSSLDPETYADIIELLKIIALKKSPDIPFDEALGKIINEELKNLKRPSGRFMLELDKIILRTMESHIDTIRKHESRISTLEERLKITSDMEYPVATENGEGYTADPEPEYGEISYRESVAAGLPITQSEDESLVVNVPLRFIKTKTTDYYVLRIRGNSMIDTNIPDGSLVLIRKSDVPQHDVIQVVRIDGRATLKRMKEGENHNWLMCYEDGSGRTIPLGEENLVQGDFVVTLPPLSRPRMRGE